MKKFLKFAFVAILVAVAGYGVYASQKSDTVSDLMLANVEALADGTEIGPTPPGTSYSCVYGVSYGGIGIVRNCVGRGWDYFVSSYSGSSSCRS